MAATEIFQHILHEIQSSNLNYQMEISHFSATINLKNSLLVDKNGNPLNILPKNVSQAKIENEKLRQKIYQQEFLMESLKRDHENVVNHSEEVCKANDHLQNKVEALDAKLANAELENVELKSQVEKSAMEQTTVKQEVIEHKARNKILENQVKTLNIQLSESKNNARKELMDAKKEFKKEVKAWRKDLGEERKQKIKLEIKLDEIVKQNQKADTIPERNETSSTPLLQTLNSEEEKLLPVVSEPSLPTNAVEEIIECTICAEPIFEFVPDYFMGLEMNPACDGCKSPTSDPTVITEDTEPSSMVVNNKLKSAKGDLERNDKEEIEKIRWKIRIKVKTKLEARLRNGEISRDMFKDLEEALVEELEAELV